jgi:hypothetical protein
MTINPSTGVVGYTGAPSNGTSGTSGVNGATGAGGTSGIDGTSGSSGTSGITPASQIGATGPIMITNIWTGSQEAYDALEVYDPNVLYAINS